jgi:hypothetical protein
MHGGRHRQSWPARRPPASLPKAGRPARVQRRSRPGSQSGSLARPITREQAIAGSSGRGDSLAGGFRPMRRYTAQRTFNFCMTTERRAATRRFAFNADHHGGPLGLASARRPRRAAAIPDDPSLPPTSDATAHALERSPEPPSGAMQPGVKRADAKNGSPVGGTCGTGRTAGRLASTTDACGVTQWTFRERRLRPRCANPGIERRRELRFPCKSSRSPLSDSNRRPLPYHGRSLA